MRAVSVLHQSKLLLTEPLIGLPAAAKLVPSFRGDRPTNSSTIFRWGRQGVRLPGSKERLRLEIVRIGGRWCTSQAALTRFFAALTEAHGGQAEGEVETPRVQTPTARRRAAERAMAE